MAGRRFISVLMMLSLCFGFLAINGNSFQPQPGDRSLAVRLFEEGKFPDALPHFSTLCYNFPYDFMIKYYFGACLVETGTYSPEAEKNLVLASSADVPVKVSYYLGKLYHGQGNWNSAQRFYNRFKNSAPATEITELRVDELISLCYREINPFLPAPAPLKRDSSEMKVSEPPLTEREVPVTIQPDSLEDAVTPVLTPEPDTTLLLPPVLPFFIDFQINDKVTYLVEEMFHVPEAKNEFRIAVDKEKQLDSLLAEVQQLRKQYHLSVKPAIRDSLAIRIQNLEYRNMVLNTEVDRHYFQSRKLEQEWWEKSDVTQLEEHLAWKDSLIELTRIQFIPPLGQDTIMIAETDSLSIAETAALVPIAPSSGPDEQITYRIQIGAYDKGIPAQRKQQFEKLAKIRTIETLTLENGMKIFTTGNLKEFGDAMKLQSQIRQEGIKDAFVIAVKNGKRITLPMEKQPK